MSKDNEQHRFRNAVLSGCVGATLFVSLYIFSAPFLAWSEDMVATVSPAVLTWFVNEERLAANVQVLTPNDQLALAAQLKAEDMAQNGYFAHTSPSGITPWYWIEKVGYDYQYAGENLALDFIDSGSVTKAWMESSTHRSNLLHKAYSDVGTGVARGTFEGFEVDYVVQLYARPSTNGTTVTQ